MAEDKIKIPLFDGTNFSNWKFRIQVLLDELGLLEFIEKSYKEMEVNGKDDNEKKNNFESLKKKDKKCKSHIIQRIADSHLEYVKDKEISYDIWNAIKESFERKGVASQLLLRKKLLTMKFNPDGETLSTHFLRFDKLIRELWSSGATLEEGDVVCHLLLTMPEEYEIVVTALETLSADKLTISFVKNRLQDEELKSGKQVSPEDSTAFTLTKFAKSSGSGGIIIGG